MSTHILHRQAGLFLILAAILAGCDRGNQTTVPPAESGGDSARPLTAAEIGALSPAEVITLIHDSHLRRDYATISVLVTSERRDEMLAVLTAIDSVLDANARVQLTASRSYEDLFESPWSLAFMENNLGVFSRDMRVINQTFHGDAAVVNVQEGDNVPIVRAKLVRADGRWQYAPEIPPKAMNVELKRLAALLAEIEGSVGRGLELDSYVDAFFVRVLPQMERVAQAKDAAIPGEEPDGVRVTAVEESGE